MRYLITYTKKMHEQAEREGKGLFALGFINRAHERVEYVGCADHPMMDEILALMKKHLGKPEPKKPERKRSGEDWIQMLSDSLVDLTPEGELTRDEFMAHLKEQFDTSFAREGDREWVGGHCGGRQPADPDEKREDGTTKPCEECEGPSCEAELETVE